MILYHRTAPASQCAMRGDSNYIINTRTLRHGRIRDFGDSLSLE